MREGDLVAQAVVLLRLDDAEVAAGVGAEAARVELPHVEVGRAVHDPARELPRQRRPPADADLDAAAAPVVLQARRRADQRVAVGGMAERAVDHALDAVLAEDRHPLQGLLQPGHDALAVGLEELALRVPGAVIVPDGVGVALLVDADQPRLLLHADVAGDAVVADDGQLPLQRLVFRNGVGDEIVVRHRRGRQVVARPERHLPGIGAARVDHVLGHDRPLLGLHQPFAARLPGDAGRAALAHDGHAQPARPLGQREGRAGRVEVAVVGRVQHRLDAVEVVEGVELCGPLESRRSPSGPPAPCPPRRCGGASRGRRRCRPCGASRSRAR